MSIGAGLGQDRGQERDFSINTPEDFVNKFGGNCAINKVKPLFHTESLSALNYYIYCGTYISIGSHRQ